MPLKMSKYEYMIQRAVLHEALWTFFDVNNIILTEKRSTYLIAPGSTVTSAAAISVEIVKVLESTILTVPPLSCVGCTCENLKANGLGMTPFGLTTSVALSVGGTIEQWSL
jgi:hypothetical protein